MYKSPLKYNTSTITTTKTKHNCKNYKKYFTKSIPQLHCHKQKTCQLHLTSKPNKNRSKKKQKLHCFR